MVLHVFTLSVNMLCSIFTKYCITTNRYVHECVKILIFTPEFVKIENVTPCGRKTTHTFCVCVGVLNSYNFILSIYLRVAVHRHDD